MSMETLGMDEIMEKFSFVKDFFASKNSDFEKTKQNIISILRSLKRFYIYPFATDKLRHIVYFLSLEEETKDKKMFRHAAAYFKALSELIPSMKPSTNKSEILNSINSKTPFDYESQTMPYKWRQQYTFEENVFFDDKHLKGFIEAFIKDLKEENMYFQFDDFAQNCASYFQDQYSIPEDQPQTKAFSSRALYSMYLVDRPLFPYQPADENFIRKISFLRKQTPEALLIREKFVPNDTFTVPLSANLKPMYPHTISVANFLPFLHIPDDLFYYISLMHDVLSEELVDVMYNKSKKTVPLFQFRGEAAVGQEDIMPIIIMILVLSDIPNLPEIINFFNEYSMQIQINSKTGLYMANFATAFGAIMNWEIPEEPPKEE
jgi:hypothetical protein